MSADVLQAGGRPRYVAIITDGNGRWAQRRGLPVVAGHEAGADAVKARLRDAAELGIKELTVYSFSTENWSRDPDEVAALMEMFARRIEQETPELDAEGVRMRFIGRRSAPVAPDLVQRMEWAEHKTCENTRITLFVAFNYGGRAEIVDAARTFNGTTEAEFRAHLYAPDMHDPDLIIRTSGEQRISNYLLWQGATQIHVPRRAVAGLLARGVRGDSGRVRRPPSQVRGPLMSSGRGSGADDRQRRADARADRAAARQRPNRPEGRRRPATPADQSRSRSDLWPRVAVAVPAAIIAIIFVDLGGLAWALLMIAIGAVCMFELYRMLDRWRPSQAVGFAALAAMVIGARYGSPATVLEIAVVTLPVTFLVVMGRGQRSAATVSIAGTLLGVYWLGFAFAHSELLRELPHGGAIIIDVLIGTFLGDTAAYFGGRLFGRRPLAPSISPNKTVEGLFCGMLISILAVFVAGLYQAWLTHGDALLLGLTVAVLGPVGDLFESVVKRDAGAKDAGNVFGAHGGALDRLDAVIFTVVAGYYVWLAVMH